MTDKHADVRERYFGKARPGEYIEDRTIKEDVRRLLDEVDSIQYKYDKYRETAIARLKEFQEEINDYDNKIVYLLDQIHDLNAENNRVNVENERLRKALEEIREGCKIGLWFHLIDGIARKALEGTE